MIKMHLVGNNYSRLMFGKNFLGLNIKFHLNKNNKIKKSKSKKI